MSDLKLPPSTRLGTLHLKVRDHKKLARFYQDKLGLKIQRQDDGSTGLGCGGEDLVSLNQVPVGLEAGRHASLYHFCLAVQNREDLGWWLRRLLDSGYELQGLVDHRMAEAIYLEDPEGNGIELNWDRPRSEWRPWSEWLAMGNAPLDVPGLLEANEAAGPRGELPSDTRVGHVHLHLGDLEKGKAYFVAALGLDQTTEIPGQAVFTSAGGYHHHIAFNVWKGRNVPPQPQGAFGLDHLTLILPQAGDVAAAAARLKAAGFGVEPMDYGILSRDPSQHGIYLTND
jgi:catechol 2,3-dioxygenase